MEDLTYSPEDIHRIYKYYIGLKKAFKNKRTIGEYIYQETEERSVYIISADTYYMYDGSFGKIFLDPYYGYYWTYKFNLRNNNIVKMKISTILERESNQLIKAKQTRSWYLYDTDNDYHTNN